MRFVPIATAFVPIAWLISVSAAVACSCIPYQSAAEHVAATPLVFKGRVLDETRPGVGTTSTRFRTLEVLKGQASRIVRVSHSIDDAGCGIRSWRGTTVLVFADLGQDGAWRTASCSEARFSETDYRRAARGLPPLARSSLAAGAPRIATFRPEPLPGSVPGGAAARLSGTLAERDGCLLITVDGQPAFQPVFREGSALWDQGTRKLILNGTAYAIGSKISVGGGGVGDDATYSARPGVSIPECGAASLWIVST